MCGIKETCANAHACDVAPAVLFLRGQLRAGGQKDAS